MDDIKFPPRSPIEENVTPKLDQINNDADILKEQPSEDDQIETINLADDSVSNPAAETDESATETPAQTDESAADSPAKPKFFKRFSRKKLLIIGGVVAALLIAGGLVYWFALKPNHKSNNTIPVAIVKKITPKAKPTSPLTGVELTDAGLANRPVTGLMIENSGDARPQSGLIDAGVVFEAIAEGGITRFLALYQEAQPQYIGPIRSARPYYIDFDLAFNAGLGHVGGSPDAMNDIKNLGVKNLDEFYNSQAYWRITTRAAPHNVYTSFARLDALNKSKGYNSSKFTPFARKKDVPQTPTASSIDFSISSAFYSPHFQYDPATNTYKRFEGGVAHVDQQTGVQISPKVVIVLVMNQSLAADGDHTIYQDVGSGKMYVFQDGIVSEGTWAKSSRPSQFVFTDKNGLLMKLNAGQTWISIVGSASYVSYRP